MPRKKKHPGGRPTKYLPSFVKTAREYFHLESVSGSYPSIQGLSVLLGVHIDQLYEWQKKYPEFHEALEYGRTVAHELLVKSALTDRFNAGFTKFLLINNFGYTSEKTESKVEANVAVSGINISFIDKKKEGD